MAKDVAVCPGCSRHCTAGYTRCKYGQKYFDKMSVAMHKAQPAEEKRYKWEKLVQRPGLAWKLLYTASRSKKALREKKLTEQQFLDALNETEQAQLCALLDKLSETIK